MNDRPTKRSRELPIVKLLPNLLTMAAVCAGMTAIRFAFEGQFEWSVRLILVAGLLDGLDGRMARLLRSQSLIGAELDSLADFLNFGVTPALVLFAWSLHELGGAGWIAGLCFALCCLMRLARFNVDNKSGQGGSSGMFFVGIPSPAGALLVLMPMIITFLFARPVDIPPGLIAIYTVLIGLLMISGVPTYSFKNITVSRENARFVLLGAVLLAAALLTYPWATLILLTIAYVAGIVVALPAMIREKRKR